MNSLANSYALPGSNKLTFIFLSSGSPGKSSQWSKTYKAKAYPEVWILRSVSKPKLSMAGILALMVYRGEPGFGVSEMVWPLLLEKTSITASILSALH